MRVLLIALAALRAAGWRMASSSPFDALGDNCVDTLPTVGSMAPSPPAPAPSPAALRTPSLAASPATPPSPPAAPPSPLATPPSPRSASPPSASRTAVCDDASAAALGTVRPRRQHGQCEASYTWIQEKRWDGGLHARLDVGGDGVIEGWLLQLTFERGVHVRARDVVGGLVVSPPGEQALLIRPRLASGLGTVYATIDFEERDSGAVARRSAAARRLAAPLIECVPDPQSEEAALDDARWRASAREDYKWMAKEFNRQYITSHGKEHDDYQPHSAEDELQLHYLNGRLWCFFGSVRRPHRRPRRRRPHRPRPRCTHPRHRRPHRPRPRCTHPRRRPQLSRAAATES